MCRKWRDVVVRLVVRQCIIYMIMGWLLILCEYAMPSGHTNSIPQLCPSRYIMADHMASFLMRCVYGALLIVHLDNFRTAQCIHL